MAGIGLLLIMAGLLFFAALFIKLGFKLLPRPLANLIPVLIIFLLFIDALIGRLYLASQCEFEGQIVLKRSLIGVEGIYYRYGPFTDSPKYYGYSFVEGGTYNIRGVEDLPRYKGLVDRATAGATKREKRVVSKSLYEILEEPRRDSFYYYSVRTVIRERATLDELASYTWFQFRGGWLERIPMALSGAGPSPVASCGNSREKHLKDVDALHRALEPL
jgi:hypothetical protein